MYLSVIIPARNDNYGGDFLDRLEICVKSLSLALEGIDWELILVDYNSDESIEPLSCHFKKYSNICRGSQVLSPAF